MKVKCKKIIPIDADESNYVGLIVGNVYEVLEKTPWVYRLIGYQGEPFLYGVKRFEVIDDTPCQDWEKVTFGPEPEYLFYLPLSAPISEEIGRFWSLHSLGIPALTRSILPTTIATALDIYEKEFYSWLISEEKLYNGIIMDYFDEIDYIAVKKYNRYLLERFERDVGNLEALVVHPGKGTRELNHIYQGEDCGN